MSSHLQLFRNLLNRRQTSLPKTYFSSFCAAIRSSILMCIGGFSFSNRGGVGDSCTTSNNKLVVVVRSSTVDSNPPQQIFHSGAEFSFPDGIDDRVTQRTEKEDAVCCKNHLCWDFIGTELTAKASDPFGNITQHKRRDDNGDIYSCLPLSSSSSSSFSCHLMQLACQVRVVEGSPFRPHCVTLQHVGRLEDRPVEINQEKKGNYEDDNTGERCQMRGTCISLHWPSILAEEHFWAVNNLIPTI